MATGWRILKPRVLQRAHASGGGRTVVEWVPHPYLPEVYVTNLEAKQAYLRYHHCGELTEQWLADRGRVEFEWRSLRDNLKLVRLERVRL